MRTMGQKRAEFALNEILYLKLQGKSKEDFKSFTAGAPSMILQNGFGQALAFWLARGDKKHIDLFNIVKKWLLESEIIVLSQQEVKNKDYILAISTMDHVQYLAAQNETLKLLEWVKRYANADL